MISLIASIVPSLEQQVIEIPLNATVFDLKKEIADLQELVAAHLEISFEGIPLHDSTRLVSDAGITSNCEVSVDISKKRKAILRFDISLSYYCLLSYFVQLNNNNRLNLGGDPTSADFSQDLQEGGPNFDDYIAAGFEICNVEPLLTAVEIESLSLVNKILLCSSGRTHMNNWAFGRKPPLLFAVEKGLVEIVERILQEPECNVNVGVDVGLTALLDASERGNCDIIKLLLQKPELDVNQLSSLDFTALHNAVLRNHVEAVSLIVSHPGVYTNLPNKYNDTPLHTACANGRVQMVKLLLPHVEVNRRNWEQCSPFDVTECEVIRSMLREHGGKSCCQSDV